MDTAGFIYSISTMAQGLDYLSNRVGDSIKLQNIEIRFRVVMATGAAQTQGRIIVFRDLDGYGTLPTVADVLQTASVLSPKNYLKNDRFSILYDELFALSQQGDSNEVGVIHLPHEGHVKYLGTTAAAASNGKGSIYVLIISNESGATVPFFAHHERIYFTDD